MTMLLVRCSRCGTPFTVPEEETKGVPIGGASFFCAVCVAQVKTPPPTTTYTAKIEISRTVVDPETGEEENELLAMTSFDVQAVTLVAAARDLTAGIGRRWEQLIGQAGIAEIETVE